MTTIDPSTTPATPTLIPHPRNHDQYRQYIRQRFHRFHARPYKGGKRHYLGSFPTYHDARRAVVKFFQGTLKPLPKFVRGVRADGSACYYADDAQAYVAEIRTPLIRFRSHVFPTREQAHAAAVAHLDALVGHIRDLIHPHGDRGKKHRPVPPATSLDGSTALGA